MSVSRFYRDRRAGKIMGVCAGISHSTGVDVVLVRVAALVLALGLSHGMVILAYVIAGFVADDLPRDY